LPFECVSYPAVGTVRVRPAPQLPVGLDAVDALDCLALVDHVLVVGQDRVVEPSNALQGVRFRLRLEGHRRAGSPSIAPCSYSIALSARRRIDGGTSKAKRLVLEVHGHYPSPPELRIVYLFPRARARNDALNTTHCFPLLAYNLLRSGHLDRHAMHRRSS